MRMRWNDLFADLEGQLGAAADSQFAAEVADRTRGERASVALESRLAAGLDGNIVVTLMDGEKVFGELTEVAATWILVNETRRQSWIPMPSVAAVSGLETRAVDLGAVARRLSVGHALRALSRDRAQVSVVTRAGDWPGVIAQVGADYLDVSDAQTRVVTAVPFAAIVRVVSRGSAP